MRKSNFLSTFSHEIEWIVSIQVPHALGDHAEFKMNIY